MTLATNIHEQASGDATFWRFFLALCWSLFVPTALDAAAPEVRLNEAEFRDRVYACWTGKHIGGTLGMPFEGKQDLNRVTFYTNLKGGQAAPRHRLPPPLAQGPRNRIWQNGETMANATSSLCHA